MQRYNGDEVFPDMYSLQSSITTGVQITGQILAREAVMRTDTRCPVFQL